MLATLSCSRFCVRCTRRSEHAACEAHHETRVAQHTTFVMTCGMLCTAPVACAAQAHGLSIRRALCGYAAEALRVYRACAAGRRCTAVAFAEQLRAAVADAAERSRCEHTVSVPNMANQRHICGGTLFTPFTLYSVQMACNSRCRRGGMVGVVPGCYVWVGVHASVPGCASTRLWLCAGLTVLRITQRWLCGAHTGFKAWT